MSRVIKVTEQKMSPQAIEVRGARVHNLKDIDIDIPLGRLVGIAGVSGSGKSSLALGVLYAEGSRRYLEALSTYTRRRLTQAEHAQVDEVLHVPAALALHQRPSVPGVRSTFGTMTELNNSLRLLFSRCAHHVCPHCGARVEPSLNVAAGLSLTCPACGREFYAPSAEDLAFNSGGACPTCGGTGVMREVDEASLVPDESKTINEGAVLPWGTLMLDLMKQVAGEMGVRTDVPFNQLTPAERDIVFHGPAVKKHILYVPKKGEGATPLDFTYYNAVYTVENALAKVKDDKGLKRVARFLREGPCRDCGGTRLSEAARQPQVRGINLAQAAAMTLGEAIEWARGVPASLPAEMQPMATDICDSFLSAARRLVDLGLDYLSLDRAGATLSTGERQRVQLARVVRNRSTGVLYVLDEPSIGLHQRDNRRLIRSLEELRDAGNSVIVVEHDEDMMRAADFIVDVGPRAGRKGGNIVAAGTFDDILRSDTITADYLTGRRRIEIPETLRKGTGGRIVIRGARGNNLKNVTAEFPLGKFICVTGVSGSGKSTLVNETLRPILARELYRSFDQPLEYDGAEGLEHIDKLVVVDQSPIGRTPRSNPATYSNVFSDIRKLFEMTPDAQIRGFKAGRFSFNVKGGRCEECRGAGVQTIEMNFLPDVYVRCKACGGHRYNRETLEVKYKGKNIDDVLNMTVNMAVEFFENIPNIYQKLRAIQEVGLGYLTLGQPCTTLSGGESQRIKLSSELSKRDTGRTLYILDEPTTGLHFEDIRLLLEVLNKLVDRGNTVIVIEHNLDVIKVADHIIDIGPEGGAAGGEIIVAGTPHEVAQCEGSYTGQFLKKLGL